MKYRIIATLILLLALGVAYVLLGGGGKSSTPNSDPDGLVIH